MTFSNKALRLEAWEINVVLKILNDHVPEFDVVVFGSRAGGEPAKFSDLDLAIITDDPLGFARIADLNDAFNESDLAFKVDLVDWTTTSESFRKIIRANSFVIKERLESFPQQ